MPSAQARRCDCVSWSRDSLRRRPVIDFPASSHQGAARSVCHVGLCTGSGFAPQQQGRRFRDTDADADADADADGVKRMFLPVQPNICTAHL
jgi:hypothetical protein